MLNFVKSFYPAPVFISYFLIDKFLTFIFILLFFFSIIEIGYRISSFFYKKQNDIVVFNVHFLLGLLFVVEFFYFLRVLPHVNFFYIKIFFLFFSFVFLLRLKSFSFNFMKNLFFKKYPLIVISLMFIIVLNFILKLVGAFYPPTSYDGLEYHLAIINKWFSEKKVFDDKWNLYTSMPMGWECIYAIFYLITGKTGQILHCIMGIMGLLNLGLFMFKEMNKKMIYILFVILFFSSLPEFFYYSYEANVDLNVFYLISILPIFLYYLEKDPFISEIGISLVVSILLFSKYTTIILYIIPLGIVLSIFYRDRFLKIFFISFVFFLPHLLKNFILFRNPFYPLFSDLFSSQEFFNYSFFLKHHKPSSLHEIFTINKFLHPSFLSLVFIYVFFNLKKIVNKNYKILLFFSTLAYVNYFLFTKGTDRFIFPLWGIVIVLFAYVLLDKSKKFFYIFSLIYAIFIFIQMFAFNVYAVPNYFSYFMGLNSEKEVLRRTLKDYYPAVEYINTYLPKEKILFIGEARTYYIKNPENIIYSTPFNYNPVLKKLSICEDPIKFFKKKKIKYVLVNEKELERLKSFYGNIYYYVKPILLERFFYIIRSSPKVFKYGSEKWKFVYIAKIY